MLNREDLPPYIDLILPTLRAVETLGGSALAREITAQVTADIEATDEMLSLTYDGREKSVLLDRMDWARSYATLGGFLDRPSRGVFVLSAAGRDILSLPEEDATPVVRETDRRIRAARHQSRSTANSASEPGGEEDPTADVDSEADVAWREDMLERLHRLSPEGFEEFVVYLLRLYGMELTRRGGPGDEGIDGIGLAPINAVLASRVAVQAKRYEPSKVHGREVVALFQRDAAAAGAERAVLVTLGRFSSAARNAATAATPTVNLVDGEKLCDLIEEQAVGLRTVRRVDDSFFDRFDPA